MKSDKHHPVASDTEEHTTEIKEILTGGDRVTVSRTVTGFSIDGEFCMESVKIDVSEDIRVVRDNGEEKLGRRKVVEGSCGTSTREVEDGLTRDLGVDELLTTFGLLAAA